MGVRWRNSVMGTGILPIAAGCSALIKATNLRVISQNWPQEHEDTHTQSHTAFSHFRRWSVSSPAAKEVGGGWSSPHNNSTDHIFKVNTELGE